MTGAHAAWGLALAEMGDRTSRAALRAAPLAHAAHSAAQVEWEDATKLRERQEQELAAALEEDDEMDI